MILLLALFACQDPAPAAFVAPSDATAWIEDASDRGGRLVVQVTAPVDAAVTFDEPLAPGLTLTPDGDVTVEPLGEVASHTKAWRFTGPNGSYELSELTADVGGAEVDAPPLFVDLGVPPPREGELADIPDPPRLWRVPWLLLAGAAALVALLAIGARRVLRRPAPPPPPPPPPHSRALAAWERARTDASLDDAGKAAAASQILREYLEEILAFPATSWTTSEILGHLGQLAHLDPANLPRCKRLLRATDLVKFADARGSAELIVELDADLKGVVESTRPRRLDGGR